MGHLQNSSIGFANADVSAVQPTAVEPVCYRRGWAGLEETFTPAETFTISAQVCRRLAEIERANVVFFAAGSAIHEHNLERKHSVMGRIRG
jgi:hypothetical protein